MNDSHSKPSASKPATADSPKSRKPYRCPDFQCEKVFETMALACGKIPAQSQCTLNKKKS